MSNILGIGTDIVEIKRIRSSINEYGKRFLQRLFTENERNYCDKHVDSTPHYAGRFAGKEAVVKALGSGFGAKISWHDIEILNDTVGKPIVHFSPIIQLDLEMPKVIVSISHEKEYVTATALWISTCE